MLFRSVKTNKLSLDLKQLLVDSIELGANKILYSQVGERVHVTLDKIYNSTDSIDLKIYYHGTPAADPGGWGGFYFSGDYAFNLGVGFTVSPHSFGRAWFPCVDEFPMKSAYELAMERLSKSAPAKSLTARQKADLAELESLYKSRLAQLDLRTQRF
mgnify:CR=1 FL=1